MCGVSVVCGGVPLARPWWLSASRVVVVDGFVVPCNANPTVSLNTITLASHLDYLYIAMVCAFSRGPCNEHFPFSLLAVFLYFSLCISFILSFFVCLFRFFFLHSFFILFLSVFLFCSFLPFFLAC
jgi:hypothetical protein